MDRCWPVNESQVLCCTVDGVQLGYERLRCRVQPCSSTFAGSRVYKANVIAMPSNAAAVGNLIIIWPLGDLSVFLAAR